MKNITRNRATRVRFLRENGWSITALSKRFKMSREYIKKICTYQVIEVKETKNGI